MMSLALTRKLCLSISVVSILLQTCLTDDIIPRLNVTNDAELNSYTSQSNEAIPPRGSQLTWRNLKFPARPPRLRTWKWGRNTTTTTRKPVPSTTERTITTVSLESKVFAPKQNTIRRMDIIDSSSSEHHPRSVVWPLRLRSGQVKRFRVPTPTTPAPQVLLKLLQPKPTRPAIYSLDGFVPKPSIKKISSTTEPPYKNFNGKADLQQLSSTIRRRKINRFNKHDEEDDYNENEATTRRKKPVSRYTAFARKGIPGQDYPVFGYIPQTDFQCGDHSGAGLFADQYTNCQVWHMCPGGNMAPRHSFLCPNGTIFNQKKRICDWWYNVDCKRHFRNKRAFNLFDTEDIFEILYPDGLVA